MNLWRSTSLAAVALAGTLLTGAAAAADPFLVPVGKSAHGFGAFRPTSADHDNVRALKAAFGPPSSYRRRKARVAWLEVRWRGCE